MNAPLPGAGLAAAILAGFASAQSAPTPGSSVADLAVALHRTRTPIHTAPADRGVEYGIWGAGADYKAGFDGGFRFVPFAGDAYPRNQFVAWRTASVRMGDTALVDGPPPEEHRGDYRYEYRWPLVTEAYDVLVGGVEQTFVIAARVADGDLAIVGDVRSSLRAAPRAADHAAIEFADPAGNVLVSYGAATVIDAQGRRLAMSTAIDEDQRITLAVPDAWLDTATFPIVVDPILAPVTFDSVSGQAPADVDLCYDAGRRRYLVSWTRRVSASDTDLFANLRSEDLHADFGQVFADITSVRDADRPAIAVVESAGKFVLAYDRRLLFRAVAVHTRDTSDLVFSTATRQLGAGGFADVGGARQGDKAIVVYGDNTSASGSGNMFRVTYDATGDAFGTPADLIPADARFDRRRPRVSPFSNGSNDEWLCVWQEFDTQGAAQLWRLSGTLITNGGGTSIRRLAISVPNRPQHHQLLPVAAGMDGRYLVGVTLRDGAADPGRTTATRGSELFTARVDWTSPGALAIPRIVTRQVTRTVADGRFVDLSYDHAGDSWWGASYLEGSTFGGMTVHGFDGGEIDRAGFASSGTVAVAGCYESQNGRYALMHGGTALSNRVQAAHVVYRNVIPPAPYGFGCGGKIGALGPARRGNEFFFVNLDAMPPIAPCAFLFSVAQDFRALDAIGMPGCFLLVDQSVATVSFSTTADSGGHAFVQVPLPSAFARNLFVQGAFLDANANVLGVAVTEGLQIDVR